MKYLIPLVIVLILVGVFVTFLVLNATRRGRSATRSQDADGPPGIGQDETPLGDTSEHAGDQTEEGTTVGRQDADEAGGTGTPVESGYEGTSTAGRDAGRDGAHVRRSGEAEGTERLDFPDVRPPSAAGGEAPAGSDARPDASQREDDRTEPASAGATAAGGDDGTPERADAERDRADEGGETRPASERLADRGF